MYLENAIYILYLHININIYIYIYMYWYTYLKTYTHVYLNHHFWHVFTPCLTTVDPTFPSPIRAPRDPCCIWQRWGDTKRWYRCWFINVVLISILDPKIRIKRLNGSLMDGWFIASIPVKQFLVDGWGKMSNMGNIGSSGVDIYAVKRKKHLWVWG